jgi:hypothetical protein
MLIFLYFSILLLIYIKTRSIKKSIGIVSLFLFITIFIGSLIIITDSRNLSNIEDTTSLMVLSNEEKIISALSLNFSSQEPIFFDENDLKILNLKIKDQAQYEKEYFKIFIFEKEAIIELLSDEITISKEITITKEQIIESLNSKDQELLNSIFILTVSDIFQRFEDPQQLKRFIEQYKEGNIQIYPPIKVLYLMTILPEDIVNKALSKIPKNL